MVELFKKHPLQAELVKLQNDIEKLYKQASKQGFADDEVKYSIEYTTDNKPVVIVEDNILVGAPKSEWVKTVKKVIADKFPSGLPISGRLVKVNKITREEYTSSKYSKFLRDNDGNIYIDKFKSANNLDEIILATTNYINEDLNHKRKDSIKEFARGDVLISVGNNDYSAKVIVGFTGQNMVLYDVVDFTPANFDIKKKPPHTVKQSKTIRSGEASSNNILQKNEVVNSSISEKSQTEAGLDNSAFSNGEKYSLYVDNKNDKRYNINNETNRKAESNGRTNEFRELQEASRRLSNKDVETFHRGSRAVDEGLRRQLSRIFRREIFSYYSSNGNSTQLLKNSKYGIEFKIVEEVDATLFHDVFEIVQKYLRNLISNLLQ